MKNHPKHPSVKTKSSFGGGFKRVRLAARQTKTLIYLFCLFLLLTFNFLFAAPASAICPVCTAAAIGGVGLSRWLGIDDLVSGLWIGGALASVTGWTISWLNAKEIRFKGRKILVALLYYGLVVIPLYYSDLVNHPGNKYLGNTYIGIDKLILAIIVGTISFVFAVKWYEKIKAKNGGRARFPFQKIVMPIGTLLILSVIAYLITK
ncbi:MAG: hypothetical protein AAB360_00950 [Patescibacteria group bacterium]